MGLVTVFRFQAKAVFVLFLFFVQPLAGLTQTLYLGSPCDVNDVPGMCKGLADCPSVLALVQNQTLPEKVCSYQGSMQIVCCPKEEYHNELIIESDKSSDNQADTELIKECPERPFNNMKIKDPQFLTWNKCVEFSQQVYCGNRNSGPQAYKDNKCGKNLKTRIIAGNLAEEMEFPHMALLGYTEQKVTLWRAGGTLISSLYVLTAAHTLDSHDSGIVDLVRLGVLDRRENYPESTYEVVSRIPYPKYSVLEKCYSDIGLIKLNREVQFSERIRPACLPSPPLEPYMTNTLNEFVVSGWGVTEPSQIHLSHFLRKVTVDEFLPEECVNRSICTRIEEWTDRKLICAGSRKSRADSCQGDSGGPIQVRIQELDCPHAIVGIVSTGQYCGHEGVPASYTRVSPYLDWIVNITWPNKT